MSDLINTRKNQHIKIISADKKIDRQKNYFDAIHLKHRALPEIDLKEIDPSVVFMGHKLSFPLMISSMTGGDHELVRKINKNLAIAAEATGVAMAVGSQRVMFTNSRARKSFELRRFAPNSLLFSNLGAVQLNYGFNLENCQDAIETVGADALYFHFNPLQEAIQPEGDTNFVGLAEKVSDISRNLSQPVILKEVGAGFSDKDVECVIKGGIQYIDVAGSGGTSWSRVENYRQVTREKNDLGILFQDWGNPTPLTLKLLNKYSEKVVFISSGGVRTGIDIAKSIILGASLCGMAKPFLKPAMDSPQRVIRVIKKKMREFVVAMFVLGVKNFKELYHNESLIANPDFNMF